MSLIRLVTPPRGLGRRRAAPLRARLGGQRMRDHPAHSLALPVDARSIARIAARIGSGRSGRVIALMLSRTPSGRSGQAVATAAKSGSIGCEVSLVLLGVSGDPL